ncbi:response regulator transcription factor [Diaphorobacter ruginosibacter]|uniref:Response regulator transcription factor n=1 Tax=Diaphorobacter ruginosibacter TaxID=1715720 RepID=A0A7G9RR88_9BURK|nr:response regulator transcription factor [Diaphorobacter ruginosibacter]QNN58113.1 response regulator transcription factor [Diaphorobacter ruginosibacter]
MSSVHSAFTPTVAVVEDDDDIRANVCTFLQKSGMKAWGVDCAEQFYVALLQQKADLVVVDLGLPGEDGLHLIRRLAGQSTPVIALTGRGDSQSRIEGLNAGALQYFVKPVDLRELVAGIRSQLRHVMQRAAPQPTAEAPKVGTTWRLDRIASQLISPAQQSVRLTGGEFELMHYLMSAGGGIVNKLELVRVLGYADVEDGLHSIASHLARMRRKTLVETGSALPVRAVFGKGLAFVH